VSNLAVLGILTTQETQEIVNTIVSPSTPATVNWLNGAIYYVTGLTSNLTVNITNLPVTANRSYVVVFILVQGLTPYYINTLQIAGVPTGILWPNATVPTPTASRQEFQSFTLYYDGAAWSAWSQFTSFG
jgi:hypothetical protein